MQGQAANTNSGTASSFRYTNGTPTRALGFSREPRAFLMHKLELEQTTQVVYGIQLKWIPYVSVYYGMSEVFQIINVRMSHNLPTINRAGGKGKSRKLYSLLLFAFKSVFQVARDVGNLRCSNCPWKTLFSLNSFSVTVASKKNFTHPQKLLGSTEIWTRIAGFRVQSANHYTMEPLKPTPGALLLRGSHKKNRQQYSVSET